MSDQHRITCECCCVILGAFIEDYNETDKKPTGVYSLNMESAAKKFKCSEKEIFTGFQHAMKLTMWYINTNQKDMISLGYKTAFITTINFIESLSFNRDSKLFGIVIGENSLLYLKNILEANKIEYVEDLLDKIAFTMKDIKNDREYDTQLKLLGIN